MYVCMYVWIYICMYIYIIWRSACKKTRQSVCVCVCVCVCVRVCSDKATTTPTKVLNKQKLKSFTGFT